MLRAAESVGRAEPRAGADARNDLLRHALKGRAIARRYAQEIKKLSIPDSAAGRNAEDFLTFATDAASTPFIDEQRRILEFPTAISREQSAQELGSLELAFSRSLSEIITPPTNIASYVPELTTEFTDSQACTELGKVGE